MQQPDQLVSRPRVVSENEAAAAPFQLDITLDIYSLLCRVQRRCAKCDLARQNLLHASPDPALPATDPNFGCSVSRRKLNRKLNTAVRKALVFNRQLEGAEYHGPLPGQ